MFIPHWVIAIIGLIFAGSLAVIILGFCIHRGFLNHLKEYIATLEKAFYSHPKAARVAMENRIMTSHFTMMLACFLNEAKRNKGKDFNTVCVKDIINAYVDHKTGTLTLSNNKAVNELTKSLEKVFYDYVVSNVPYIDLVQINVQFDCENGKKINMTNIDVLEDIKATVNRFNSGHKAFFK